MVEEKKDPIKPTAWISKLSFSGGDEFEFLPNQKVLIVGANNSGKSKTLGEMFNLCSNGGQAQTCLVLKNISVAKNGNMLHNFLEANAKKVNQVYQLNDWHIHESMVQYWDNDYLVNGLSGGFIRNVTARDRLLICEQQSSIGPDDAMSKPQHILYQNDALLKKY